MNKDTKTTLDRNEIARRAYEIYLARGKKSGSAHEDWVRAEAELRAKAEKTAATTTTTAPKTMRRETTQSRSAR